MRIQPLKDRVVVKKLKADEKTAGGLYIPESAQEKEQHGEVVAVADNVASVKVGDKVLYSQYGGTDITVDKQDFVILELKDVLALIIEDKK